DRQSRPLRPMRNRILDLSDRGARLRVRFRQLIITRDDADEHSVPLEDLAVVIATHPQVTFSQAVLAELAAAGGVFVVCDEKRTPAGMLLPLAANSLQTSRFAAQAAATLPTRK